MIITANQTDLAAALARVAPISPARNNLPILGGVLLEAFGDTLTLTCTDLDQRLSATLPVAIEEVGTCCVEAKALDRLVKSMAKGEVEIKRVLEAGKLNVRAGRVRGSLAEMTATDFPTGPSSQKLTHTFSITAGTLCHLARHTGFAMSSEETRYYLCGVYLHEDAGLLRAVATDGHRMSSIGYDLPKGASGMPGIIVPTATMQTLARLASPLDATTSVTLALSKTWIEARFAGDGWQTVLGSKLVDGTFPDYSRVIPQAGEIAIELEIATLTAAVSRAAALYDGKSKATKLALMRDQLTVSSRSDGDERSVASEIDLAYAGPNLTIGMNGKYLLDILRDGLDGGSVRITLSDAATPVLIRDLAPKHATDLCVLMPMRV